MYFFLNNSALPLPGLIAPKRIVSLVPSQTELLFHLGLENEVAGITKFCIHPAHWRSSKTIVGGTKKLHLKKIEQLSPDLIIANKEENEKSQIEAFSHIAPVCVTDINNLQDACSMILQLGTICNKADPANILVMQIQQKFAQIVAITPALKTAYFIWNRPFMVAASNTFINEMLMQCGFENVFADLNRYPEVSAEQIKAARPQLILLSSEPYPFKAEHVQYFQQLIPSALILQVDGEMFSWYGSRLLQSAPYFQALIHQIQKK